ncbi:hypothetical protein Salat_0733100 [Sesamum alatum]|uniref:Myb/SANT-like domain-containing protein n=1 Tax=Sesamum alatum TaxID=300844 RepID=A0AAE2CV31_9LAMI|nr:hypothetical protein Salat_0733100 [Sesamum alatum]
MENQNPNAAPPAAPQPPFLSPPPPQSYYFYNRRWTKQHDHFFIQELYYEALKGQRQFSRTPNMHSLNYGRRLVNAVFNFNFKYIVFKCRLDRLRLGYMTFRTMLDTPGVVWNRQANIVVVEDNLWNNLVMNNEFVNAYRYRGKSMWKELRAIFSAGDEDEGPQGVVDISSDDGGSEAENVIEIEGDEGSDRSNVSD